MTNYFISPDFRIKRKERNLDIFKRYFNYLADLRRRPGAPAYELTDYNNGISNRIRFNNITSFYNDLAEEKFDKLPFLSSEEGFYENFIWSYGGLTARSQPAPLSDTQKTAWRRASAGQVTDPREEQVSYGIADKDLVLVPYSRPSLHQTDSTRSSRYDRVFNIENEITNFVQDYTYIPGQSLNFNAPPDNQPQDIRGALGEYLATIETTGNRNRTVVSRFLREIFFNTPHFGDQRQDSDMSYQGIEFSEVKKIIYREQLTGEVGFEKFVRLLTEAPIQSVTPRNDLPSNLSLDLNRDGVIEYEVVDFSTAELLVVEGSSLYAVGDRPPIRRAQPYPRSGNLSFPIDPLRNLQNLSEVVYALLGSSNEGTENPLWINYNMFKEQLQRAFGVVSPARVYEVLRTLNIEDLREFDSESIGKRLLAARQTTFTKDLGLEDSFATVEYYNFRPFMKPVFDYRTYRLLTDSYNVTDAGISNATSDFSTIYPHYNFYLKDYEEAIASPNIPENILPNMYIYSFVTDREIFEEPLWNDQSAANELQGSFDRLITLGEFEATSLPRITSGDGDFLEYLTRYSNAVRSYYSPDYVQPGDETGVVIEFVSELARENYHITTPASEMNIYDRLNGRKSAFPMAIETTFPMATTKLIGSLIDDTLTSTSFVNSVVTTETSQEVFDFICSGLLNRSGVSEDRTAAVINDYLDVERTRIEAFPTRFSIEGMGKLFDFNEWMLNAQKEIEVQTQTQQGRERYRGQCPNLLDAITFESIRNSIKSESRRKMISYEQILKEDKIYSDSETIIYKLVKYRINTSNNGVDSPFSIQSFYFPNSKRNDLVKFVDTQVKYNTRYRYELYGIEVVYGSKFEMRVLDSDVTIPPGQPFGANESIYSIVNVKSTPSPKIIEFPIYGDTWRNTSAIGGLFYPDIKINDRPPPPPQMLISPLRDNFEQLLLSFQTSNESFTGNRAIPWVLIEPDSDWQSTFLDSILHQKQFTNFSLESPNCEFSSESGAEVQRIEVYRSDEVPTSYPSEREFYKEIFGNKLHKILDISGDPDVPAKDRAIAFDCLDTLEVNKKYYYTARAVDVHGKVSNPGPVYVAEIVFQRGTYYPYVEIYVPKIIKNSRPTRKMSRFIEIKAAPIQSGVKYSEVDGQEKITSQRGFVDDSDYRIENNKFLVRLTSRDTGRKIQFNISFKQDKTQEET